MQREKQHMRIVIDEYGGVSGLVTIEDLLEQIVGNIRDEHETETPVEEPQREPNGVWLVPATFPSISFPTSSAARSNWAKSTRPQPSAAWSARSKAAFPWPVKSSCSSPSACVSRLWCRRTAASTGSAFFRQDQKPHSGFVLNIAWQPNSVRAGARNLRLIT